MTNTITSNCCGRWERREGGREGGGRGEKRGREEGEEREEREGGGRGERREGGRRMNEDIGRELLEVTPTWIYVGTGRWLLSKSFSKQNAVITL